MLQEQLTGLPVAKRARHGIHFQKGAEIEAHFTGKPAHYLDGGLWKPIDTGLLATADGGYSSPHSDVVIYPDGRVKVRNSDYQQFTELPSAKTGKLVGDKIIRTFPGGEQWLIMKEDGFREEIHVNKQKIPVEKFIAKTTGNLPSKYKAHPITAEDAEGNSYTFTGDVAAFGAWLDKAVYPVVIDPDFAGASSAGYIYGGGPSYSTAHSTSTGNNTTGSEIRTGQYKDGTVFAVNRSWVSFDSSSIGGGIVTQANLKLVCYSDNSQTDSDILIKKYVITGTRETDYDGILASDPDDSIWRSTSGMSVNTQYSSGNLSTAWVNKTGTTFYCLMTSRDRDSQEPTQYEHIRIAGPAYATTGYRPVLTVLYSAGGVPKHFMHYQRLRSL